MKGLPRLGEASQDVAENQICDLVSVAWRKERVLERRHHLDLKPCVVPRTPGLAW